MRHPGLTFAAAGLAAALAAPLAGCGKSPTTKQSDQVQASSSAQPTAEPTLDQKKAAIAGLPAPYNTADLDNGEAKFAVCKSCHTLTPGGPDMTGPNLSGVFGRQVATKAGFKFSDPLKAQTFTWDVQHLDTWLTDPKAMVPGTKMTFPGFKDAKDRTDVIGYLKAETSPSS